MDSPSVYVARIRRGYGNADAHLRLMPCTNSCTGRRSTCIFRIVRGECFRRKNLSRFVLNFAKTFRVATWLTCWYHFKAGAQVRENLTPAHIVLGIKEVPLPELITSSLPLPDANGSSGTPQRVARTHLMFSHTTKGQPYNMPLLSRFVRSDTSESHELLPKLIDYELLKDSNGKRTVGFGWFAGGEIASILSIERDIKLMRYTSQLLVH